MFRKLNSYFFVFLYCLFCFSLSFAQTSPASGTLGATITNQAQASYSDPSGNNYHATSNPVSLTVLAVVSLTVTSDDTQPTGIMTPNEQVTRVFRVCNTGNVADNYSLTQTTITPPAKISALYWDVDNSGTLTPADTPITVNSTLSPLLQPSE